MTERPDNDDVGRMIYDLTHTGELSMLYRCRIADALDAFRALDAHTAAQPAPDHTDLSWAREICDDPEKLDAFMQAHPLPPQPAPDAVAEADNWNTIGAGAVDYLREMYRPAYDALGSSGRTSLRNWINTRVDRAITDGWPT